MRRRDMNTIELFAGAGGLALGLHYAGFKHLLLNEIDKNASTTLKNNLSWNVINKDVASIDFSTYKGQVDLLSGGIPCQAFSYAGKQLGFEDTRGTLFFEFARALKETEAKMFLFENVKGLLNHDNGNTLNTMLKVLDELGYEVFKPKILDASLYDVPQKRERLFVVGIRKELKKLPFEFMPPQGYVTTIRDALFAGRLYTTDVPHSEGAVYNDKKKEVMKLVPPGGWWKHLPVDVQKSYMGKVFGATGGSTGLARRTSFDLPSPTLLCSPAQKLTERCHPSETRPFTVREYARIQTFPDFWEFYGSMSSKYKQIGNAVPVNLALAVGTSIKRYLEDTLYEE